MEQVKSHVDIERYVRREFDVEEFISAFDHLVNCQECKQQIRERKKTIRTFQAFQAEMFRIEKKIDL